jgi:hypothetical protein
VLLFHRMGSSCTASGDFNCSIIAAAPSASCLKVRMLLLIPYNGARITTAGFLLRLSQLENQNPDRPHQRTKDDRF